MITGTEKIKGDMKIESDTEMAGAEEEEREQKAQEREQCHTPGSNKEGQCGLHNRGAEEARNCYRAEKAVDCSKEIILAHKTTKEKMKKKKKEQFKEEVKSYHAKLDKTLDPTSEVMDTLQGKEEDDELVTVDYEEEKAE